MEVQSNDFLHISVITFFILLLNNQLNYICSCYSYPTLQQMLKLIFVQMIVFWKNCIT